MCQFLFNKSFPRCQIKFDLSFTQNPRNFTDKIKHSFQPLTYTSTSRLEINSLRVLEEKPRVKDKYHHHHHHHQLKGRPSWPFQNQNFNFWNLWIYFRHLVGLLGRGISQTQSLYLHRTTQHSKTQTHIHTSSEIRTQNSSVRAV